MLHKPEGSERFAEVPESVLFTLRFPSGAMAMCACGFGTGRSSRFRVLCDKGYVQLDPAFPYNGQELETQQEKTKQKIELSQIDQFAAEMDHFSQCVRENKPNKTPGEEGLQDVKIMTAIEQAIREGGTIKIA